MREFLCCCAVVAAVAPGVARAQSRGISAEVAEAFKCVNGTAGTLTLTEAAGIVGAGLAFGRVSDCDSSWTAAVLPAGACSVRPQRESHGIREEGTPSSTLPAGSTLDAGPEITLEGSGRQIKIPRLIFGASTSYYHFDTSSFDPFNPTQGFRAGRYAISAEGGRDIPAFRGEFELSALAITRPVNRASVSGQAPLAIEWTGTSGEGSTTVNVRLSAQTENWEITCRIRDGAAGSFTIPAPVWSELPASVRTGGVATVTVSTVPRIKIDVPNVDGGLEVLAQRSASVTALLFQAPTVP